MCKKRMNLPTIPSISERMNINSNEIWIKYYSSAHNILLVGEGDFSFSACLGVNFGSATNIVATTLDSYDVLIKKYKYAEANLLILRALGASVLHGVDATKMMTLPHLQCKKFHRIIYNFPHAGFLGKEDNQAIIAMHRDLVHGFLLNASSMLCIDGEIHVNHKTGPPFDKWKIEELGSACSLVCVAQDKFRIEDYPGYSNKRGSGARADESFPLGSCKTYRFILYPFAVRTPLPHMYTARLGVQHQTPTGSPIGMLQPTPTPTPTRVFVQQRPPMGHLKISHECCQLFGRYLNNVEETFGDTSYDVRRSVEEALQHGYETYMRNAGPGRPMHEYNRILEELHQLSILRSQRLRQLVYRYGSS